MNRTQSFFLFYLSEIRWKVFYGIKAYFVCFFCCYLHFDQLIFFFSLPLYTSHQNYSKDFITTEITEAFYTSMSISFYASFVFCLPLFFYLVLTFLRSSYYQNESDQIFFFLTCSLVFFIFSHIITLFGLLPIFCSFLLYFDTDYANDQGKLMISLIQLEPRLSPYISFTLKTLWGCHFICQTPLISYFIFSLYPKSSLSALHNRRYIYFLLLCLAALVSPPDVSIQFFCFFLLIVTFESTILSYILLYNYSKKLK